MVEVVSVQDEVAGLDRVLSRLAVTEEDKLEKVLSKLIPAVIGALKSPHEATKKKVLEILSHVNKRIKGQQHIKLPLQELVALYVDASQAAMVRNFALVYLETAFDRADGPAQLATVGPVLQGVTTKAAGHQAICLRVALAAMDHATQPMVHPSQPTPETLAAFPFLTSDADRGLFLSRLLKLLLYQPVKAAAAPAGGLSSNTPLGAAMAARAAAAGPTATELLAVTLPPAGLSSEDVRVLEEKATEVPLSPALLARRKLGILHFLATAAPPPAQVLPHLLVAACDPAEGVSRRGEELLKKVCSLDTLKPSVDLDDDVLLSRLFGLFHGSQQDDKLPQDKRTSPAGPLLRSRLLQLLCKSMAAARCFPDTLRTIYEAVFGPASSARLKAQGMEFAVWVFKHAESHQLKAMGPTVLQGLLRTLDESGGQGESSSQGGLSALSLRSFAYQAVSSLAARLPELLQARVDVAQRFFAALEAEPPGVRATVQEAVSSLAQAYRGLQGDQRGEIDQLLLESVASPKDAVRLCAIQWAVKLHPFTYVPARYICILAAGDIKNELREEALKGLRLNATYLANAASGSSAAVSTGAAGVAADEAWPSPDAVMQYVRQRLPRLQNPADQNRSLPLPPRSFLALIQLMQAARSHAAAGGGAVAAARDPEVLAEAPAASAADYSLLLEHALVREASSELVVAAMQALLDVAAQDPAAFAARYGSRSALLREYTSHVDAAVRVAAAKLLGLAALNIPDVPGLVASLAAAASPDTKGVKFEEQEGSIMALGFILARCSSGSHSVSPTVQRQAVASLCAALKANDSIMAATAAMALGHIALQVPLPGLLPASIGPPKPVAAASGTAAATPAAAAAQSATITTLPASAPISAAAAAAATAASAVPGASALPEGSAPTAAAAADDKPSTTEPVQMDVEVPTATSAAPPEVPAASLAKPHAAVPEAPAPAVTADVGGPSMRQLLDTVAELMAHKDVKVAVRAISAAGLLCHGVYHAKDDAGACAAAGSAERAAEAQALLADLLTALFKLSGSKAEDVQFAVGEAISFAFGSVEIAPATILGTNFVSLSEEFSILKARQQQQQQKQQQSEAAATSEAMDVDSGASEGQPAAEPEPGTLGAVRAATQKAVTDHILSEFIFHSRTETRCAATIWLVSLLTYAVPPPTTAVQPDAATAAAPSAPGSGAAGSSNRIMSLLPDIQDAFSNLLGDSNELTQEMASRGVSMVYSLGGPATREKLVSALVNVLQGGAKAKQAVKLTGETQVFEAGQVGAAPGGGSISTYKELCALATDLGQPDLVYKFMDLAQHQAALNTRRGAAFGFAGIAHLAGKELGTHVAALIPKLYRYQYDPNPRVQDAMASIWRALVDDPKQALDEHFDAVMKDLLREAGGRLWRNRQASCAAIADLLTGRSWSTLSPHLDGVWTMMLRCMDDIKDSVRTTAAGLARSVRNLTLRLVDPQYTSPKETREAVALVLPLLLEKAVGSSVAEVRALGMDTIAKLAKAAGAEALRPHLGPLVTAMLEALSSLEDSRLNYIEQHAERMGFDNDRLEGARVSASRSTPMGDTLDICARFADATALEALVPVLSGIIRRGVGLNTKVGTARFIRSLATRAGSDIKAQAPALIKALVSATRAEHSNTVRKAYAGAAAQVAKYASDKRVEKLVTEALALYTDAEGDKDARLVGGLLLRELLRAAPEAFQAHAPVILPLAFGAKLDEDTDVAAGWKEVWEEGVSSEAAAIRLYTAEIVGVVLEGLASQQWGRKKACAEAVAQLAEAGGSVLGPYSVRLAGALVAECSGRLWDGKEKVLDALAALVKVCATPLGSDYPGGHAQLLQVVLAALARKKASWRVAALKCLLAALKAFPGNHYALVSPLLVESCRKHCEATPPGGTESASAATASASSTTAVAGGTTDDAENADKPLPLSECLDCLAAAANKWDGSDQTALHRDASELSQVLAGVLAANQGWQPRLAAVNAVQALVQAVSKVVLPPEASTPWLEALLPGLLCALAEIKVLQVRMASLTAVSELLEASDGGRRLPQALLERTAAVAQELAASEADRNGALSLAAARIRDALAVVYKGPLGMDA